MSFDNRIAVEERYPDRYAPMSEQERQTFDSVNRSIWLFAVLIVAGGIVGVTMIVYPIVLHFSR